MSHLNRKYLFNWLNIKIEYLGRQTVHIYYSSPIASFFLKKGNNTIEQQMELSQ